MLILMAARLVHIYLVLHCFFLRICADFYLFYVDIFCCCYCSDLQLGMQHDFAINSNLFHPHSVVAHINFQLTSVCN